MDDHAAEPARSMLGSILQLSAFGSNPEEIAAAMLNTDSQTALFRATLLVEIIIDYARRYDLPKDSAVMHPAPGDAKLRAVTLESPVGSLQSDEVESSAHQGDLKETKRQ